MAFLRVTKVATTLRGNWTGIGRLPLWLGLATWACGGPGDASTENMGSDPIEMSGDTAEGEGAETVPWAEMTLEQRQQHMAVVVTPKMAEMFKEFDPELFADFSCVTCHGSSVASGDFATPSPDNSPLDPRALPSLESEDAREAAFARFMIESVTPEMTRLLGAQSFDPMTRMGFGCFGCHPVAE